jgi:hypothetical protein
MAKPATICSEIEAMYRDCRRRIDQPAKYSPA